jgi:hypothetical protein
MGCCCRECQRVRENKWRKFDRIFASGSQQVRYIAILNPAQDYDTIIYNT